MPDVTIHISVGAGDAAVHTSSGTVVASQATTEAPPPMPLEQLQLGAAQAAPAPKAPEELSRISAGGETQAASAGGSAPPPLEIAQLLSTSVEAVPTPHDIGAFTLDAGPPAPQPLEELGLAEASAPAPMSLEQLEAPTPPYGGESGPAPGGTRRKERSG